MREIKFRALSNTPLNRWVDTVAVDHSDFWYEIETDILNGNTLCQFTGLHDKNGKEIWEGDILSHEGYSNGVVKHSLDHEADGGVIEEPSFISCWGIQDNKKLFRCFMNVFDPSRYMVVIGNIYENSDLLKDAP